MPEPVIPVPGKFTIWKDEGVCRWRWECTFCRPPSRGARGGTDAWERIIRVSLPGHLRHRRGHHIWVARHGYRHVAPSVLLRLLRAAGPGR